MSIHEETPQNYAKPPAPYLGGKRLLSKRLVEQINKIDHTTYAEPFVGMGGVFFRRNKAARGEVINDRNKDVSNLFRILQRHYTPFMDMLRYQLTTRADFERLIKVDPDTLTDLERAVRFLYLQRTAFGGKISGNNFGVSTGRPGRFDVGKLVPALQDVFERLQGVVIENLDYEVFIRRYDRKNTLFYLDPPYWNCENDYGPDMFSKDDFYNLADILKTIKGQFILSINDVPEIRQIFGGFQFLEADLMYSVSNGKQTKAKELIIMSGDNPYIYSEAS